jgi:hypothetical protein
MAGHAITSRAVADSLLATADAPVSLVDYEPWYQVEIILFSNLNPTNSNEAVTAEQHIYPHDLLSIGPQDDDQLTPLNPQQQAHLVDDQLWLDSGEPNLMPELRENSTNEPIIIEAINTNAINPDGISGETAQNQYPAQPSYTDPTYIDMQRLPAPLDLELLKQTLAETGPRAFSELGKQTHNLDSVARSISRSSRYRLLRHLAWRQPMTDEADALPILFQLGEQLDGQFEVDGTLQIYRSRFLHVITDLWFTRRLAEGESLPLIDRANLDTLLDKTVDKPVPTIVSMPLRHARRMRSATLHFIDHPQFGMLVRIDKYDGPEVMQ